MIGWRFLMGDRLLDPVQGVEGMERVTTWNGRSYCLECEELLVPFCFLECGGGTGAVGCDPELF